MRLDLTHIPEAGKFPVSATADNVVSVVARGPGGTPLFVCIDRGHYVDFAAAGDPQYATLLTELNLPVPRTVQKDIR